MTAAQPNAGRPKAASYGPARIVFFGMHGVYAAVPLEALVRANLRPSLVVVGKERASHRARPTTRNHPARGSLFDRARAWIAPSRVVCGDRPHDLVRLAHAFDIDAIETEDANGLRARARIHDVGADIFVVAGFPQLLSTSVLELARVGGLNIHPGRLPEERGPSPLFWALARGGTRIGVTIHVLDRGEDTGDVVAEDEIEFSPGEDLQQILERLAMTAAPRLVRCVRSMLDGDLVRTPQPRTNARRARPTFRDGAIDPCRSAREVFTFVSGCAANYSLFVECGGDRFFIRRALSFDPNSSSEFDYVLTGERLLLRCNPGVVELELKPDGAQFASEYRDARA